MPTRERSAPTSARSCRHCPQDCAHPAPATLGTISPPPGSACAIGIIPLRSIMGKSPASRPNTPRNTDDMPASHFSQISLTPIKVNRTESHQVAVIFKNTSFDAGTIGRPKSSKTGFGAVFPRFQPEHAATQRVPTEMHPRPFMPVRGNSC